MMARMIKGTRPPTTPKRSRGQSINYKVEISKSRRELHPPPTTTAVFFFPVPSFVELGDGDETGSRDGTEGELEDEERLVELLLCVIVLIGLGVTSGSPVSRYSS